MTSNDEQASSTDTEVRNHANLIWSVAELLRGDYKQADYGKVILPLVVMRRLDQMLEPTRDAVIAKAAQLKQMGIENPEGALRSTAKLQFFNRHPLRFHQLLNDPGSIADQLDAYIDGYSVLARQAIDKFDFESHIPRLKEANLLYKVIGRICDVDLHPDRVSNADMGAIFEELIRRFSEASNETAGEHYTPREVVRLMVNLLLDGDEDVLTHAGVRRRVFDCACGTGGMLSEMEEQIHRYNPGAEVILHGQELNPESYAICLGDMLIKGQDATHIVHGNSLASDGHAGERFHYCIANPPFGVDWSKVEETVRDEHESLGFDGRFGPGLPRKSDGQLLFLMHLLSKMRTPEEGGGRLAIVHNGSPLFTGAAGSGESEIRRYLLEHDLLEAIVALPEQLFYNTGIASYVWLVTNRKTPERQGRVQLIDARETWTKMRKSLGEKRRYLTADQIAEVTRLHGHFDPDGTEREQSRQARAERGVRVPHDHGRSAAAGAVGGGPGDVGGCLRRQAGGEARGRARRGRGGGRVTARGRVHRRGRVPLGDPRRAYRSGGRQARRAAAEGPGRPLPDPRPRPRSDRRQAGQRRRRPGSAGHRERPPHRRRRRLPRPRGPPARPRRLGHRPRGQDRLRDPLHAALLQVHAAAAE
ncbi:MAG: N-6 DNA methylase [Solirubrobacteraceae bacterium]